MPALGRVGNGSGRHEGPSLGLRLGSVGRGGRPAPRVSQPELLASLPEPEDWAEGQPSLCQGPADRPLQEPGTQPRKARGEGLTLPSRPAWASRSSTLSLLPWSHVETHAFRGNRARGNL